MREGFELVALFVASSLAMASVSRASDHGVAGQTFPIIEPDLLSTIEGRLQHLQATGGIDRMNADFAKRAEAKVRRPTPVASVTPATEARSWVYDPTIVIQQDVRDQKGNLIARAGQTVNPLDFVTMHQALVFVDGDDKRQMDWATSHYDDLKAKIILVSGSPIEEMTARQRRFYFDQEGRLTGKLGVHHTPAVGIQDGHVVKFTEILLKGNS